MTTKKGSGGKKPRRNEVDRDRLLEYFFSNAERPIKNSELADMLGAKRSDSWTRRLRELRLPKYGGYQIFTVRDRDGLASDEYWFPKQARRPPESSVSISNRLRADIFERDAYTCQLCGLARGQKYENGRLVTLHVGHDLAESLGGKATSDNCFTLCARCNEGESNIGPTRPSIGKTMQQVRRLPKVQQRAIYDFLRSVFDE